MEYIYHVLEILAENILSIFDFLLNIPNYINEVFAYAALWLFDVWLQGKIFMLKIAINLAQELLANYGVYDLIQIFFNKLPSDLRYVLTAYGVPDGLRMLFDAYATAFILRFVGW